MKNHRIIAVLLAVLAVSFAAPATAKTVKIGGMSCWTGELDLIGTTDKDMGWAYTLNYTWLADDKDPKKSLSGRCVSSGGMVDGKYESAPFFCTVIAADGSKRMTRGVGGPAGSKSVFFGGTGTFTGIEGTVVGGPRIKLPAPKGSFAACRYDEVEYTLPD
jgi:hypothetical protein